MKNAESGAVWESSLKEGGIRPGEREGRVHRGDNDYTTPSLTASRSSFDPLASRWVAVPLCVSSLWLWGWRRERERGGMQGRQLERDVK